MSASDGTDAAGLLARLAEGDENAAETLLPLVYDELHGIARRLMAGQNPGHTLQTTALMNEAWMRLSGREGSPYESQQHFLRVAARAMRSVLVDHARRRAAKKRGGDRQREALIHDAMGYWEQNHTDLLALDEALTKLGERDRELQHIVELRFFGGLTLEETGVVLAMSVRQVHRRWTLARGWLHETIAQDAGSDA